MTTTSLRIRGIYAMALTVLALKRGFAVVDPSPRIQERLGIQAAEGPADVLVEDRTDLQGVALRGVRPAVNTVTAAFQEALEDACFWQAIDRQDRRGEYNREDNVRVLAEFPSTIKGLMDQIRAAVVPTIPGHHYLKTIDSAAVDRAERGLRPGAEEAARLGESLKRRIVYARLRPGMEAPIQHTKPGMRTVLLRGRVASLENTTLTLRRVFQAGGVYDSLNLPKLEGDWGTLVLPEGDWVSIRRYFRKSGDLIGEIYNIGTPAELYPDHVRYVDLEVDVVRWADGRVEIVDQEDLEEQVRLGHLPKKLAEKAVAIAEDVATRLRLSRA